MHITIIGAGAIGGTAGAYLSAAGHDVLLVDNIREHLGPTGIRVNSVAPGLVLDSVMTLENPPTEDYPRTLLKGIPIGRTARGEEIASAVLYLGTASGRRTSTGRS